MLASGAIIITVTSGFGSVRARSSGPLHRLVFDTRLALAVALVLVGAPPALAQSAENVALVINDASPASVQVGEHYRTRRGIPDQNVIRINTPPAESIARGQYVSEIETPISAALRRHQLQDRILYIVLTKGVPLRIEGSNGHRGTVASVDSELTLLYRRMTGRDTPVSGRVPNPYFLDAAPVEQARPFTHREHDIYLVARLDGFTVADAIALVDRAQSPSSDGRFVLDQRADLTANSIGDRWLEEAQAQLTAAGVGDRVELEQTTKAALGADNVLGYYSWGSNDPQYQQRQRQLPMRFVPGALAAMFVSTDARTFEEPPADWAPTNDWKDRSAWFGGSPQSLTGDLIRAGVTGVAGNVAEPYLQSAIRPQILFAAYARGFTLVESFYLAMPDLSWQTVVVGDPLCRPFAREALTRAELDAPLDPTTELPTLYSARRAQVAQVQWKADPAAVERLLQAEARLDRGDLPGQRAALEAALEASPGLVPALITLALVDDAAGNFAAAKPRYQQVLKAQPNHAVALNNLAYGLAVYEKSPAEALPLARRAATLAPNDVSVLDTHAWVEHLAGNSDQAARLFQRALQHPAATPRIRLNAATAFAASGDLKGAAQILERVLADDPSLGSSEQVRELRERLKPPATDFMANEAHSSKRRN